MEASGAAPKGQGKTQRDLILEAVEALKTLGSRGWDTSGGFNSGAYSSAFSGHSS